MCWLLDSGKHRHPLVDERRNRVQLTMIHLVSAADFPGRQSARTEVRLDG